MLSEPTKTFPVPCPSTSVTGEQLTDVVIKWLDDHPEKRDRAAPYLIDAALNEAFPCN